MRGAEVEVIGLTSGHTHSNKCIDEMYEAKLRLPEGGRAYHLASADPPLR